MTFFEGFVGIVVLVILLGWIKHANLPQHLK